MGGFLSLGAAAGAGSGHWDTALRMVPTALLDVTGALLLSTPALLVVHQFLDLRARPEQLISAMSSALARTGHLAWGLSWVVLFFAATSSLWLPALLCSMAGLCVVAFVLCRDGLNRAEREASEGESEPIISPRFTVLIHGWLFLTVLIALRLGFDLGAFVLHTI